MLSFMIQIIHLLFCWCWAKVAKTLWNLGFIKTQCKNCATRNYQRASECFGKI